MDMRGYGGSDAPKASPHASAACTYLPTGLPAAL